MANLTIRGATEIRRALRTLEPKLANRVIRQALRKAQKPIAAETKALAPVDEGTLRSAVKVRAMRRKRGRIGVIVIIGQGDFKGKTFYGAMKELGTKFAKALHFMKRAFQSRQAQALEIVQSEIAQGIEREAKA